jgi:phosphoglycolate phosphatase
MIFTSVLFDLDGTLLDTLADLANSWNRSLASLGFPTHPVESYRNLVGDGVQMLLQRALPEEHRDEQTIERCKCAYVEDYAKNWNRDTRLYEGMAELLDALTKKKMRLAVLSNKLHEFTETCCAHYLGRWKFEVVLGQTPDRPRKPDPAGALEVARRMNEKPDRFIYVGDTATDMQTAKAAGMYPVGALWGFRTADELQAAGARVLIKRPIELLEVL